MSTGSVWMRLLRIAVLIGGAGITLVGFSSPAVGDSSGSWQAQLDAASMVAQNCSTPAGALVPAAVCTEAADQVGTDAFVYGIPLMEFDRQAQQQGDVHPGGRARASRPARPRWSDPPWPVRDLAKEPEQITIADVIRAVEGSLASVRGAPPEDAAYPGAARELPQVWIAVRKNLRNVVEHVALSDVAFSRLPRSITDLAEDPDAWVTR